VTSLVEGDLVVDDEAEEDVLDEDGAAEGDVLEDIEVEEDVRIEIRMEIENKDSVLKI
jgi:hypothetical protein